MTEHHSGSIVRFVTSEAVFASIAVSLIVADLHLPGISWQGDSLSPLSRTLALGLVWSSCIAAGLLAIKRLNTQTLLGFIPTGAMLGWAGISSLTGLVPTRSVYVWLGFCAAAFIALLLAQSGIEMSLIVVAVASGVITYASLAVRILGLGHDAGRLYGVTLTYNIVGQIGGLLIVSSLLLANRGSYRLATAIAAIPAGLIVIYLSNSRTAAVGVLGATVVLLVRKRAAQSIVVLLLGLALVAMFVSTSEIEEVTRRTDTEDLSNLSGRPQIWDYSIDKILERPFLGAGLATGPAQFFGESVAYGAGIEQASSHNLAIEIAREIGLVGLGLTLAMLLLARPWRLDSIAPLFYYLLATATTAPTSGLPGVPVLAWFIVISVGVTHFNEASR